MSVSSISIPIHSTRSHPSPHVVYQLVIRYSPSTEPTTIYRRYSDVAALHSQLLKELTVKPPYSPPPKTTFPSINPWAWLDDSFLATRKKGLERYLRGLVQGRHAIWKTSKAFKAFITDPPSPQPASSKPQPTNGQTLLAQIPTQTLLATPSNNGAATATEQPVLNVESLAAVVPAKPALKTPPTIPGTTGKSAYIGANSYYLHTLPTTDRNSVLSQLSQSGFSVVRIFINQVPYNNKGSGNAAMNDVETGSVGNWDDSVLEAIDSMMVECKNVGIQLIIALHDRYSLGWDEVDVYATTYGIVPAGTGGNPGVTDASAFYSSTAAQTAFDNRIKHILSHVNTQMGNLPWSQLGEVIYAFEPENESQSYMTLVNPSWANSRAATIKTALGSNPSGIKITNGGGADVTTSLDTTWAFGSNFDIICVHDYSTDPWDTVPTISNGNGQAISEGKALLFEEWGADGDDKVSIVASYVQACADYNLPWCYWEVVIPGAGDSNYETWTTEPAWTALTTGSA